jgi:hypothetical protein
MAITLWMDHFWKGLATSKFVPKTEEEIRNYIAQNHFGGKALIELSDEDKEKILPKLLRSITWMANDSRLAGLCEKRIQHYQQTFNERSQDYFVTKEAEKWEKGKKTLSKERKEKLLSNPNIWFQACYSEKNCTMPLTNWGMRHIEEYRLEKPIREITERIKQRTGRDIVNVLDIGGAGGIALKDIKTGDPRVSTWNMTMDMEPVTHDVDRTYLCVAERFPAELRESADLIISNYSFVYFPCQALALENCLQSLSVGEEAHLSISFGKQSYFLKDSARRMRQEYDRLIGLRDSGKIDLRVDSWEGDKHALVYQPDNCNENEHKREHFYPPTFVKITKLKSLD